MMFDAAPKNVRDELTELRHCQQVPPSLRQVKPVRQPEDGALWYPEPLCAICGGESHVNDHCHVTGLMRGRLCRSCNIQESLPHRPAINEFWQLHAPDLAVRTFYTNSWTGRARPEYLSDDEVMTLPLADLHVLAERRYVEDMLSPRCRRAADVIGRALDRGVVA